MAGGVIGYSTELIPKRVTSRARQHPGMWSCQGKLHELVRPRTPAASEQTIPSYLEPMRSIHKQRPVGIDRRLDSRLGRSLQHAHVRSEPLHLDISRSLLDLVLPLLDPIVMTTQMSQVGIDRSFPRCCTSNACSMLWRTCTAGTETSVVVLEANALSLTASYFNHPLGITS